MTNCLSELSALTQQRAALLCDWSVQLLCDWSVLQVDTDVTFLSLSDDTFDGQITKDLILEDTLHFLLLSHTHLSSETHTHLSSETHTHLSSETHTHLSEDEFLLLLQFQQQMKTASAFELVNKRLNNAGTT